MLRYAFLLALVLGTTTSAQAQIVTSVIDGDTLVLEGGAEVRLTGIQAPKLALGRAEFQDWPLADQAKAALESLVLSRKVELRSSGADTDRHGRTLAQVYVSGRWVQAQLVQDGMARVYTFADNRAPGPDLLRLEARARYQRIGIWNHPFYTLRDARDSVALNQLADTFQLVEGTVCTAASGKYVYLNFAQDWKTDFTVRIAQRHWRDFEDAGWSMASLAGTPIRVRGWIEQFNGPMITLDHPERLERLPPNTIEPCS